MDMTSRSTNDAELRDGPGLNRRAVLMTAVVAAGAAAGVRQALTDTVFPRQTSVHRLWSSRFRLACSRWNRRGP